MSDYKQACIDCLKSAFPSEKVQTAIRFLQRDFEHLHAIGAEINNKITALFDGTVVPLIVSLRESFPTMPALPDPWMVREHLDLTETASPSMLLSKEKTNLDLLSTIQPDQRVSSDLGGFVQFMTLLRSGVFGDDAQDRDIRSRGRKTTFEMLSFFYNTGFKPESFYDFPVSSQVPVVYRLSSERGPSPHWNLFIFHPVYQTWLFVEEYSPSSQSRFFSVPIDVEGAICSKIEDEISRFLMEKFGESVGMVFDQVRKMISLNFSELRKAFLSRLLKLLSARISRSDIFFEYETEATPLLNSFTLEIQEATKNLSDSSNGRYFLDCIQKLLSISEKYKQMLNEYDLPRLDLLLTDEEKQMAEGADLNTFFQSLIRHTVDPSKFDGYTFVGGQGCLVTPTTSYSGFVFSKTESIQFDSTGVSEISLVVLNLDAAGNLTNAATLLENVKVRLSEVYDPELPFSFLTTANMPKEIADRRVHEVIEKGYGR